MFYETFTIKWLTKFARQIPAVNRVSQNAFASGMENGIFLCRLYPEGMKTNLIIFVLSLLFAGTLFSQVTNIQIGVAGDWPNEPAICMNPANTGQIVIGVNPDQYYLSDDGGATWQHGILTSSFGVNCDPVIVAGNDGNFYYFHLVPNLSRVVCQKMEGFQPPWSDGSYTAVYNSYDIDKEWAVYDPVHDNLYTSWTRFNNWGSSSPTDSTDIFISKSTDGGASWGDQKLVSNIGGNATGGFGSVHGSYPATGPNGEVYVAWWSPAGLMFDRSLDEGETWLGTDINVTGFPVQWIVSIPGIQTGVSFPVIACDRSGGPANGTIYINWTDRRGAQGDANIWLVKSTDGGNTWSEPKKVNDDASVTHQFFNFITIDQVTGKIYVIFYDRRNYTNANTDVYLAISDDGGETFANHKISETSFIPFSTVFFGHYIGVVAHNDKVFATWMRMDEGELTLWGAPIDPTTVGKEPGKAIPLSLTQNTPNPFRENTFFSFKLESTSAVTLLVTDLFGKTVATIISNKKMSPGKHVVSFSPEKWDLPSGMYHYSLVTDHKTVTKKMVYAR